MGYTAKQLVAIAEAEIGYAEKASNSNLDSKTANSGKSNYTKYSRDLHKAGYYNGNKQGFDWCDQFVDWCFFKLCGNKDRAEYIECQTGNFGAGCGFSLKYYKAAGRFDKNPKVGDQIFFKYSNDDSTADHTGIVVRVTDSLIETIEGNSGNEVRRKACQRTDKTIIGYGHPRYDAEPKKTVIVKEAKNVIIEMPILRKGSSGNAVKTLQRLLRQLQYVNLDGKTLLIVDGSFGSNSHAEGIWTIAGSSNQHVQGKYNVKDSYNKYAHIVGNGTSTSARSNAHALDWSGVPWFKGRPQFGGTEQDQGSQTVMANGDKEIILASSTSNSTKKFKITVDDSGTLTATEVS